MFDKINASEFIIMGYLFETVDMESYLYEISKYTGITMSVVHKNMEKLEEKGIIVFTREEESERGKHTSPRKIYKLTDIGEAFAWAFCYPDELLSLYTDDRFYSAL
jgi:DNA-binding MarR family transcriptional regulator